MSGGMVALSGASTPLAALSDPTPIPAGSYVTIGFSQDLLGALDILTSWTDLATQWVGYLGWPTGPLVIADTFARKDAVVAVQITNDTTVGQVATIADGLSPDVSILHVWLNGPVPPSAATLNAELAANPTAFAAAVGDPVKFLTDAVGNLLNKTATSLLTNSLPLIGLGVLAFWAVTSAEKTRTYQKYVA